MGCVQSNAVQAVIYNKSDLNINIKNKMQKFKP